MAPTPQGRVKADKPIDLKAAQKPSAAPPAADGEEPEAEADEGAGASQEADSGSGEAEDHENPPVVPVSAEEIAGGRPKGKLAEVPEVEAVPTGTRPVLDSPRDFGIWVKGKLHRFRRGRTPLTAEQHQACQLDGYVADNGASIFYMPLKKPVPKATK